MSALISNAYVGGVVASATSTSNLIFPIPASMNVPTNGSGAAVCEVPGSGRLNGRAFSVTIAGYCDAGASMNVTPVLYSGTSLTVGSNVVIATGTAFATGGALKFPWVVKYAFQGENISGILQFTQSQQFHGTYVAPASVTELTGINFNTTDPTMSLVFGLTFGTANAANTATLLQFDLES